MQLNFEKKKKNYDKGDILFLVANWHKNLDHRQYGNVKNYCDHGEIIILRISWHKLVSWMYSMFWLQVPAIC